ncbi:hypothetical protein [Pseudactinotalea terrae]|uniref:hypothetical protein n=1 Tax=Pseudactinotalea terrae TaxID=1743262 RepID=UPI0012E200C6|nr:hypothetical protein [Pseudactinotalea terrae]
MRTSARDSTPDGAAAIVTVPTPEVDEVRDAWVDHHLDTLPRPVGVALVPAYQAAFDRMLEQRIARAIAQAQPCRVRIRLTHSSNGTPYKWRAACRCGWRAESWQWLREDRTGALVMGLQHVGIAGGTGYDN